jgi:hypothetical protein
MASTSSTVDRSAICGTGTVDIDGVFSLRGSLNPHLHSLEVALVGGLVKLVIRRHPYKFAYRNANIRSGKVILIMNIGD